MFINFSKRNFSYRGDKGTWAREEANGDITVQIASKGIISDDYLDEIKEFISQHEVVSGDLYNSYGSLQGGGRGVLRKK